MKKILCILLIAITGVSWAQDHSYNYTTNSASYGANPNGIQASTMVIPFHADLYISHFDAVLAAKNKTTEKEVKRILMDGFMQALADADTTIEDKPGFISGDGNQSSADMYASFHYEMKDIPADPTVEETTTDKWKGKWKSLTQKSAEDETVAAPGQLVAPGRSLDNKYLGVNIKDKSFLTAMRALYGADNFIFINQFELILPTNTDQLAIQHEQNAKLMRIHFSIVDAQGNEVDGGIVEAFIPNQEYDLDVIMETYYPAMAQSLMKRYYYFRS